MMTQQPMTEDDLLYEAAMTRNSKRLKVWRLVVGIVFVAAVVFVAGALLGGGAIR